MGLSPVLASSNPGCSLIKQAKPPKQRYIRILVSVFQRVAALFRTLEGFVVFLFFDSSLLLQHKGKATTPCGKDIVFR